MTPPVDPARYAAFLGVMAVMAATPGPANLFSIAMGAARGRRAAIAGVLGMNTATAVWFVGAAVGLSALIFAFPQVFRLLAWAGAAYVAWLGLKSLWSARAGASPDIHPLAAPKGAAFRAGFTVQIANPKAVLFFSAVLPPFLDPHRPLIPQLLAFAAATLSLDLISMTTYGIGGAVLAARLSEPGFRRGFAVFVGLLLIAAAILIGGRAG